MPTIRDQYGAEVPQDLVVIDFGFCPETLINFTREPEEVQTIYKADWYELEEYRGILLASAEQINFICETDPLDCGFPENWQSLTFSRVADPLKRWSPEDGFYHA